MTVNDTDKFLVNRSGSSYHLEAQNLMAELPRRRLDARQPLWQIL